MSTKVPNHVSDHQPHPAYRVAILFVDTVFIEPNYVRHAIRDGAHPGCIAALEAAPKLNPVVVEDAGAAPKLKPFALESSALAAPEPKEKVDGDEVV